MPAALLLLVLFAAPSKQTLAAIGCAARKCTITPHAAGRAGTVLEVVLPNVLEVDGATCGEPAQEWWLVDPKGATQKLLAICNNGYGAAGIGEDTVEVKGEAFVHSRSGGSNWRWTSSTEVRLLPVAIANETHNSMFTGAPNLDSTTRWDWDHFEGTETATVAGCGAEGPAVDDEARYAKVESAPLPVITLPTEFRAGGWKETGLGSCSASARWTTFGKKTDDRDATLRAVMATEHELYVEVRDDVFVETAATWVLSDHLELWLSTDLQSPTESCMGRKDGFQWGVGLDGKVTAGFGSATRPPVVEVARADGVIRFKLSLPAGDWHSVTLLYSDTDDGKKQKRLIATSTFKFAQPATLGRFHPIAPERAQCTVADGVLKPKTVAHFSPHTAVIGD